MTRALCFLAIASWLTACGTASKEPPLAGYPHSPGDVAASGARQDTRTHVPRVETEWQRHQPLLSVSPPGRVDAVGLMPVWLAPHQQGPDVMGGQWIWTPSHPGIPAGPRVAPTTPTLKPATSQDSQAEVPTSRALGPGSTEGSDPTSFTELQRTLGLLPKPGGAP